MKIMHIFYITLIASIAIITGCKKEAEPVPERPIPEYKLPDDFLRYFAFKPGSYWVYKNTKNGMLDTVTVTKYGFGYHTLINATDGKALYKYESFDGEMHSSAYPADYFLHAEPLRGSIDVNSHGVCYTLNLASNGPWGGGADDWIMFHAFNKWASYDILSGKIILESIDSNMKVSQNNYDNIKVFYLGYSSMFGQSKLRLFYVKEIGLIKRSNLDNGDDWEMINYKTYY